MKIRGLDAKSVEGQNLINRLENWQILLGVFFPPIRNMFVGMHRKENREGVEQGLASVLDKVRDAFKSAVNVMIPVPTIFLLVSYKNVFSPIIPAYFNSEAIVTKVYVNEAYELIGTPVSGSVYVMSQI